MPRQLERLNMIMDPREVRRVPATESVSCDILGTPRAGEDVLPGPFADWNGIIVYNCDKA